MKILQADDNLLIKLMKIIQIYSIWMKVVFSSIKLLIKTKLKKIERVCNMDQVKKRILTLKTFITIDLHMESNMLLKISSKLFLPRKLSM